MLTHYYQQELYKIRELSDEFAKLYPMLAPLLGERGDPDVERLLEGFAFLIAQLQERISKRLPELYSSFAQLFYPQLLRPSPCVTTIQFNPADNISKSLVVAANTQLLSVTLQNQRCTFSTIDELIIEPIQLKQTRLDTNNYGQKRLILEFSLLGLTLDALKTTEIIFHLAGEWGNATQLYHLLLTSVEKITLQADNTTDQILSAEALQLYQPAFDRSLYPQTNDHKDNFLLLQQYFTFPRKFMYVCLKQFATWLNRSKSTAFRIELLLNTHVTLPPLLDLSQIQLHCVPAVNITEAIAEPFLLDYHLQDYRLRVSSSQAPYQQIFDVKTVTGYQQGLAKPIQYQRHFLEHSKDALHYEVIYRAGINLDNWDHYLSFPTPNTIDQPYQQTISTTILLCNGKLPEYLRLHEINQPGINAPELLPFKNIDLCSRYHSPKMQAQFLWQVQGMFSFNFLPSLDVKRFKDLLLLFLPRIDNTPTSTAFHTIQSIENLTVEPCERLIRGESFTGLTIHLSCNGNHFINSSDLYFFGQVLWQFFLINTPIGGFYTFHLINSVANESWTWEPNLPKILQQHKKFPPSS